MRLNDNSLLVVFALVFLCWTAASECQSPIIFKPSYERLEGHWALTEKVKLADGLSEDQAASLRKFLKEESWARVGRLGIPGIPTIASFVFPSENKKACFVLTLLSDKRHIFVIVGVIEGETVRVDIDKGVTIEVPEIALILAELVRKNYPEGIRKLRDFEEFLKAR